jgi:hypothetical protein
MSRRMRLEAVELVEGRGLDAQQLNVLVAGEGDER